MCVYTQVSFYHTFLGEAMFKVWCVEGKNIVTTLFMYRRAKNNVKADLLCVFRNVRHRGIMELIY